MGSPSSTRASTTPRRRAIATRHRRGRASAPAREARRLRRAPAGLPASSLAKSPEHESTPLRLSFRPRNPKHALWARVGGGGGHRLEVSGCRLLTLDFCDPIDTVRAVEFARFEGRG